MACREPSLLLEDSSAADSESESPLSDSEDDDDTVRLSSSMQASISKLPVPEKAHISRNRQVSLNPPGSRKRRRLGASTKAKAVSILERVKQFPNECLAKEGGALFCEACRTEIGMKKSLVKQHVNSKRHVDGKKKWQAETLRQKSICRELKAYESRVHPVGETLPEADKVWRVNVVTHFLKAGIALSKADRLRPLLESHGPRLANVRQLSGLIPFIQEQEKKSVKEELAGHNVSIIFDGSTRLGEALAVIIRFVDLDTEQRQFLIKQRLVRLEVLAKSLDARQLARVILVCLGNQLQIMPEQVVAAMHDGASVNTAAMRHVQVVYPSFIDVVCFSHTVDNVGRHFDLPHLDGFLELWIRLFSHSSAAKIKWREVTGKSMRQLSPTRWWSRWEVIDQCLEYFGDIHPFVRDHPDVGARLHDRLMVLLDDDDFMKLLKLEMAIVVDLGVHFVKATYDLEGDGPLAVSAYQILQGVSHAIGQKHYPNFNAVLRSMDVTPKEAAQLKKQVQAGVQEPVEYFLRKFNVQHVDTVRAFKAARIFSPSSVNAMQPGPAALEELRRIPAFDTDAIIGALQAELPAYLAAAEDVHADVDILQWWGERRDELPAFSSAFEKILLIQPSSAAAERVFSLLQASFDHLQEDALEDYLEASIMLQYNCRR